MTRRSLVVLDKYSMLTPLNFEHLNKHKKSVWRFKCDCGNEKICPLNDVKSKRIQSCGCMQYLVSVSNGFLRKINIENTKFNGYEVLNKVYDKCFNGKFAVYLCKCNCGKTFERIGTRIMSGKTKRCVTCQYIFNGNFRERQMMKGLS
jgi:hypothetical protein